ncbi:MAG: PD-(D/E)XK nuclease family protein [Aequorivita sp.]
MITFLQETLLNIKKTFPDISEITFILPSKRAGGFLMNEIKNNSSTTSFAPKICSIEEFVEDVANLKIIDSTELLFKSYEAYLHTDAISEKEDFESYSTWALTLLNDFNEMDRYLVDPKPFFSYLASIKTLERWGVKKDTSELVSNYLQFWDNVSFLYENLNSLLLNEAIGYQGMVYREAVANLEHYLAHNGEQVHIFIGFNALNTSEQHIVQELLETGHTKIYWDTDRYFFEDKDHSASHFIRKYTKEWKYYKNEKPPTFPANFEKKKHIQIIETQKNVGQAKYVGELLLSFSEEELDNTAIVLGDEHLLVPILYSLPENIAKVNVTMGAPLKIFPATVFFELLYKLHSRPGNSWYYKDILALLNHPLATSLLPTAQQTCENLISHNITHVTAQMLFKTSSVEDQEVLKLLFGDWNDNSNLAVDATLKILLKLGDVFQNNRIERAVLYELYSIFQKIEGLNQKYPHLKTVKTVLTLFSELLATSSLDFEGDAYHGLQIMGVLETRALDFENLIITSVNEGVLPSGKSNSSFITYDLKQQFGLPLYHEKDAIYTYHFYRLLHRASNISLLFNNHSEGISSGEKSRFLRQLEVENLPNHTLEHLVLSTKLNVSQPKLQQIRKTDAIMARLREISDKGFSPSALTSYIRNPMDFYFQRILGMREFEEVEETVAADTLGTIVHDSLESFYKPLEGKFLSKELLLQMKNRIHEEVTLQFIKTFKGGTFNKGKNLIVFEVAKRYIFNFINSEIAELEAGNQIKIIKIETKLLLGIEMEELDFPVRIQGKVDRVDEYNEQLRIIDYKTGVVNKSDLEILEWEVLNEDYKYSKAFQILTYALMMNDEINVENAETGIISFKNLSGGFLKFGIKDSPRGKSSSQITKEIFESFTHQLKSLILEICDPEIPFTEKEII